MRTASLIYFLLAVALLLGLFQLLRSETGRDARQLLASAERLATGPEQDPVAALAELDYALRVCQSDGELELMGDVLALRGLVLSDMGLLAQARTDLETVLTEYQPENNDVEIALIKVHLDAGELDEARTRTDDVLARDPSQSEAWTLRSRALVGLADELLEKCAELCRASLPDRSTRRAEELTFRASALDFSDPQRAMVVHELRTLFSDLEEPQSRDVLRILDEATQLVGQAREALAESFRGSPMRDSLFDYLRLLHRSGRQDLTIAYGMAAVNHRSANSNTAFMADFSESLLAAGRAHSAVEVINRHFDRQVTPDLDFYEVWCRALHTDERWKPLVFVAGTMADASTNNRVRSLANFYIGTAYIHLEQYFDAPTPLRNFVARDAIEPIPGTRALGWVQLARCYREQGQTGPEKSALRGALALEPEHVEGASAAWRRLAELIMETEPQSFADVERALTHAIRLGPDETEDLYALWREQGELTLEATSTEIELVHESVLQSGRFSPEGRVGPYELLRHAELHAASGRDAGVIVCCRRILADFPGFLPALDPLIDSALKVKDYRTAGTALLERLEYAGADGRTVRRLEMLPAGMLTSANQLKFMQLAPARYGRLALARNLQEEGRDLEALVGLTLIEPSQLTDSARTLIAELALALRRNALAKERLLEISPNSQFYGKGLVMQAEIAIAEFDYPALAQLVTDILDRERLDADALVEVSDQLLLGQEFRHANRLLKALDERADTRSGMVMLRLAQQNWLSDAPNQAHDALVRSEAFLADGAPELGYLIEAVAERRWNDMPRLVADYEGAADRLGLLEQAVLDLLGGSLSLAREKIVAGQATDPEEPLWSFLETALAVLEFRPLPGQFTGDSADETLFILSGRGAGERDPRQILVRILGLFHPGWTAAITADLSRARVPDEGSLWSTYLAARGRHLLGHRREAEALVTSVLRPWTGFVPGWDLLQLLQTERLQDPNHPRVLARQQQRFAALGAEPGNRANDLVLEAFTLAQDGDLDQALLRLGRALELDPMNVRVLMMKADLHQQRGEWSEAVAAGSNAAARADQATDSWVVEQYLAILEGAMRAAPDLLQSGLLLKELTTLEARFHEDPLIPLARGELDLLAPNQGPAVRLTKALGRFADFLDLHEDVALDSLREGSSRRWLEFFIVRDPEYARQFILEQRSLKPASLDLWRMLGETQEALGERAAAIETYEQIHSMLPDGAVARSLARLYAGSGNDDELVREFVKYAIRLEKVPPRDFGLQLIQARSLINSISPSDRNEGLSVLAGLWQRRKRASSDEQLAEIGELYGLGLTWRSNRTDRELAHEVLTEVEPLVRDPARRNVLRALSNLALQMRGP